jgi:hypothetical protein
MPHRKNQRLPMLCMRNITRRIMAIPRRDTVRHATLSRPDPFKAPEEARPGVPLSGRFRAMPGAARRSAPASALSEAQYAGVRLAMRVPVTEANDRLPGTKSGSAHSSKSSDKGTMMKKELVAVLLASCLAYAQPSAAQQQSTPPPAPAAPAPEATPPNPPRVTSDAQVAPRRWDVDRVRCSDLLGAADDDRAAAAMFYYGYLAAKAGIHVIDVSQIDGNVKKVMDRCAAAPNEAVPQAFRQALGRRR